MRWSGTSAPDAGPGSASLVLLPFVELVDPHHDEDRDEAPDDGDGHEDVERHRDGITGEGFNGFLQKI